MYKFKKVYVFIKGQKAEITDLVSPLRVESYEAAQKFLTREGFEHFMFTLEEVNE